MNSHFLGNSYSLDTCMSKEEIKIIDRTILKEREREREREREKERERVKKRDVARFLI